jgi:hypothetical protein
MDRFADGRRQEGGDCKMSRRLRITKSSRRAADRISTRIELREKNRRRQRLEVRPPRFMQNLQRAKEGAAHG